MSKNSISHNINHLTMSHGYEAPDKKDPYYLDPKEVLSQYSVEWVALRKSYSEIKEKLQEVQSELTSLDAKLEEEKISEQDHIKLYRDKWLESTEMVQLKREVEARLYEIQREIRRANKRIKEIETERLKKEHLEQEKSNAMIEWMSLKAGFELIMQKRREINEEMDKIELERRNSVISDEEYRKKHLEQISQLAELRTLETDIKRRLSELLDIIKK